MLIVPISWIAYGKFKLTGFQGRCLHLCVLIKFQLLNEENVSDGLPIEEPGDVFYVSLVYSNLRMNKTIY